MNATRTSRALCAGAVLVVLSILVPGGRAQTPAAAIAVRSGSHADFGRVVIDTSGKTAFTLDQDGDHLVVRLTGDVTMASAPAPPRNVVAMKTDGAALDLLLRHGAKVRTWRLEGRVVLDLLDDSSGSAAAPPAAAKAKVEPPARPGPALSMAMSPELGGRSRRGEPVPMPVATPVPSVAPPALPAPAPPAAPLATAVVPPATPVKPAALETTQQLPPGRDVLPENAAQAGLRARRTRLPKDVDGTAFLIPFAAPTGAAAFVSGDSTYVVFDDRRQVDLGALKDDPVFGGVSMRLLPTGTLMRVPRRPGLSVALTQLQQGWRIAAVANLPKQDPIVAAEVDGRLNLSADQPSEVVAMADPATGATLLVGTLHRAGQGVALIRRSTEFILRPTLQGVVVEPLSDAIALKQTPTGFSLTGGKAGLALSPTTNATDALMDASHLTRQLHFLTMPTEALLQLSIKQMGEAAATPPLARGPKHHAVAETLLALGLSVEAEGLLRMATEQDPKEAASPDTKALTAIAALLAGRPEEAGGLADSKLDGTDEIALWRAVRQATQDEGSPQAAAVFSATAPLVFQYPATIRERILPLIAETMIQGGEIEPAARLLSRQPNDVKLGYARALLQQAEGNSDKALALFDAIAGQHDQFDRARAAIRAVELRLVMGRLDKTQAADALDKLLYAWRGDARELALRERVAVLRGQSGSWREALMILRQAEADFPDQAGPIHERQKDAFAAMMRDQGAQQMAPIEFVAMIEENADLVSDTGDDEAVEQSLVDRLMALDLPTRAKPVLEKLMKQAKSPTAKAQFGGSLALLAAREGDNGGAVAMLNASEGPELPAELMEQRLILRAKSVADLGDPAGAAAMLAPARTVRAMETRAQILEAAQDWPKAEQAWSDVAAATVSDSGMLDEPQTRTVVRLTTTAARASDTARLAALRETYGPRIGAGALGDMFRLLTAEPISSPADIGRSQQEMNMAASVQAGLKAMAPAVGTR